MDYLITVTLDVVINAESEDEARQWGIEAIEEEICQSGLKSAALDIKVEEC